MNDFNTTAPVAAAPMTILNTRAFRVQMLAKLAGMRIDCLAKGLGAEPKPTTKVLLTAMEQTLLNAVAENISYIQANAAMREASLRDELDAAHERLLRDQTYIMQLGFEASKLRARAERAERELAGELQFSRHPEFRVLGVKQALHDIADEVVEFVQSPSRDEASDIAFGLGRLLGALCKRKYVGVWGDSLHIAKCNERFVEYGHFRSRRHLAA